MARDASGRFIKINVDWKAIEARLGEDLKLAQAALDLQILKDCDPYIPADTLELRNDGIRSTKPGEGLIRWMKVYAFAQYNGLPNKAHDKHPQAVLRWFEAAKAVRKEAWLRIAKRIGGGS